MKLAPCSAAPVKMRPRIGPAQGAHNSPVATPSTAEDQTLSFWPSRSVSREPSATNGRVIRSESCGNMSAIPKTASSASAAQRPTAFARTAQPPPTAARVATIANVAAMPASIGRVERMKLRPARAKTKGRTGRMHGERMVRMPPK